MNMDTTDKNKALININFTPKFKQFLYEQIKNRTVDVVKSEMIAEGCHPSFVKVIIRHVMKTKGW